MRPLIASSLLGLFLVGGCAQPQYLLTERIDQPATTEPYTRNGVVPQRVSLHIGNGFSPAEQAKIIAAVAQWNQSGAVRFDVDAQTYGSAEPGVWSIMKPDPNVYAASDVWRVEPIAVTRRFATSGGSIVVNVDRLGSRDLRGVIVKELAMGGEDAVRVASAAR